MSEPCSVMDDYGQIQDRDSGICDLPSQNCRSAAPGLALPFHPWHRNYENRIGIRPGFECWHHQLTSYLALLSVLWLIWKLGTRTSLCSVRPLADTCRKGLAQPLACIQGITNEWYCQEMAKTRSFRASHLWNARSTLHTCVTSYTLYDLPNPRFP